MHLDTQFISVMVLFLLPSLAAQADTVLTSAADADLQQLDVVSVIGWGETRQVQRITPQDLPILPADTTIQKLLGRMPGLNVQSDDTFGANEELQKITLRSFNGTRFGYTLDGLPFLDNAYGNYNGLNISRALISENFASVELVSGIASLGTASTSNLGGTIQYYSSHPAREFGGCVAQTLGSDTKRRTYVRVDIGEHNGLSAYLSGIDATADCWLGRIRQP